MVDLIEFETERLFLRQWMPDDREPFGALNADPRVMEFFPARLTRAESNAMADRCQSLIQERGWGLWAAELKATRKFTGSSACIPPLPSFHSRRAWKSVGVFLLNIGAKVWLLRGHAQRSASALRPSGCAKSCPSRPSEIPGLAQSCKGSPCANPAPSNIPKFPRVVRFGCIACTVCRTSAMTHELSVSRTARKPRLQTFSGLPPPPAGCRKRWPSREPV